ncbi:LysR family transcriptional regulator [Aurantivibrio plasticivorans]
MRSRLHAQIGTLRQLEIVLAVFEAGSISGAADRLFLTQPTVSMQLKKLSDAIGMPLYDVIGKQIIFTEAGRELVATAQEVLAEFERLDMNLASLRGMASGTLKLAVVTTSKYFIPHLLGPFCRRFPKVDIRLKVGNRQQIIDRLRRGEDDFYVFSHPPSDIDVESIEFLSNPLIALAQKNHPLSKRRQLRLRDIESEPFLMRESGSGTRLAIEDFLRQENIELNVRMTMESNEAIKHSVMAGLGISILSAHTLTFGGKSGLSQLNVQKLPISTHWYFLWLKAKQPTIIAEEFLHHVQTEGKDMLLKELRKSGISDRFLK